MDTSDQAEARRNPIPSRPATSAEYGISRGDLDPAQCSWSTATWYAGARTQLLR